jgi:hypothetical protein
VNGLSGFRRQNNRVDAKKRDPNKFAIPSWNKDPYLDSFGVVTYPQRPFSNESLSSTWNEVTCIPSKVYMRECIPSWTNTATGKNTAVIVILTRRRFKSPLRNFIGV